MTVIHNINLLDQSSAEFARNIRTIEANIVQMKERKREMERHHHDQFYSLER
ncbi:hypothetical protein [Acinetobacter baumannii]|uniref:hypothetical protein n=1 Tax=Acinetobacter baumannii TaxID=470 RepID=UPI0029411D98|nr:hypothetical protein [Acinetobacter baumannii]MDV4224818.1 hypothetical protein [Acinetobacter baumannii]